MGKKKTPRRKIAALTEQHRYRFYKDKIDIRFCQDGEQDSELSSIGFLVDAYKQNCLLLLSELEKYDFENTQYSPKFNASLCKLYFPAMFCFRHYIELKLKYLYMWYHKETFRVGNKGHDLKLLLNDLTQNLSNKYTVFNDAIDFIQAREKLTYGNDPFDSYFRYFADTDTNFEQQFTIQLSDISKIKGYISGIELYTYLSIQNKWLFGRN